MYIDINGQEIYYQKIGKGKSLILLHGWKQDVSTWYNTLDSLKNDFTLWLIDLPGFGRSEPPKRAFNVKSYTEIITGFIRVHKIKKPILLGHSLGGRIAIKIAAEYPEVLDKLILEASAGIKPKHNLLKNLFSLLIRIISYLIPNFLNIKKKLRFQFYKVLESDYLTAGNLKATLSNIIEEDLTPTLSKIKSTTLLIWGEKDPTKEASLTHGKLMYQLIKDSRIEVFEDAGHFPHLENPKAFVQFVKDFSLP